MRGRAFVPGHITGFFEVTEHSNPLLSGSRGCGVIIDKGVTTTVEVEKTGEASIEVFIDGKPCDCPVTRTAVGMMAGVIEDRAVRVYHALQLPMKHGFGVSGAGALGATLALNHALGLDMSPIQCGQLAHRAEVVNKTGLGDVIAELSGGLLLRLEPGAPGIGEVEKIPSEGYAVAFLLQEEFETRSILLDTNKKKRINSAGRGCMELFPRNPTLGNFLEISKKFALDTGLMSKKVYLAVRMLEDNGVKASMAMLGNTVFTLTYTPEEVVRIVDYPSVIAKIDNKGARIL